MWRKEEQCHQVVQRNAAKYYLIDKDLLMCAYLYVLVSCVKSTKPKARRLLSTPGLWHRRSRAKNCEHMVPVTHSDLDCGNLGV